MPADIADQVHRGYVTHFERLARRHAAGERRIGWKVAFSTPAARAATGLRSRLAAGLTDVSLRPNGSTFSRAGCRQLIVECEIAVRLGHDVRSADSREAILSALVEHRAAIELTDTDLPFDRIADIIAGGIFHRALFLGSAVPGNANHEFAAIDAQVLVNDVEHTRVHVLHAIGDPIEVLQDIASQLEAHGEGLRCDDTIILGCMVPIIDPAVGDRVTLRLSSGSVCSCGIEA